MTDILPMLGEKRVRQLGTKEVAMSLGVPSRVEAEGSALYRSSRTGVAYAGGLDKV